MKRTARTLAVGLAWLLVLGLFSACSCRSNLGSVGGVLDDWRYKPVDPPKSAEPAEIVTYQDTDFADTLGFRMTGYPNTAEVYPVKYFAIDGWYAQVEFETAEGWVLVVRVAEAGGSNLSSTYTESHLATDETVEMDGAEVRLRTGGEGCALVSWERDGFSWLIHSYKNQGMPPRGQIETLVAALVCEKAA